MGSVVKSVGNALGGIVGFATNFAFGLVGDLLGGLMPDIPEIGADTSNQALNTDPASRRTRIYGETVVSGPIVKYLKVTSAKKEYHHFFTPLANHPCESVSLYQLDGQSKTAMSGEGYRLIARLGEQTTALAIAVSEMSNVDSTFVGFGVTDVYHRYEINTDLFPNGVTDVKFLVKGSRVYDPRKDSTQGGTGTHLHDDESTWEWSDNAALINFDWKRFGGDIEIELALFDLTNIAHEANLCDELVSVIDASGQTITQKRYTCNGVVDLSVKAKSNEQELLKSSAGQWIFSGGTYFLAVGAYRGPAVTTITENHIKGSVKRDPITALEDRYNAVKSTFISKSLYYQKTDSTPVVSSFFYNKRDKKRYLEADRSYNFVQTDTHAQRLNRQYMEYVAAGDTLQVSVGWIGLKCPRGKTVNVHFPDKNINNKEYEILENDYDSQNQVWQLTLRETAAEIYADTILPAETDLTPNTDIDNTYVAPVESVHYTPTPNDSFRQGVLTWEHPISDAVRKYIALILREPADDWYYTESPITPFMDIRNLPAGSYTALISAENRFGRRSVAPSYLFNVGLPNTPTGTAMRVDILPGRVIIVGPELPNSAATYEWRYSFTDDFDSALTLADGNGVTIVGTRQDDTLYLWYRLKEGDLVDPNWVRVVIPNLIGLTSDEITPEVIAGIIIPGLPNNIGDTISLFTVWLNDQDYYNDELQAGQIQLFEDILMVNDELAIVDEKVTSVGVEVGLYSAKVQQAFRAIASDRMSRAILETKLQAQFGDLSSTYLKTVDLYTSAGAARASTLEALTTTVGQVNAKAENSLVLISEETSARINDIETRRVATEAVDAKATNSLQLIADEEGARIFDIEQRRLATVAVEAKADNSLELIATETQARIDDIEERRVATEVADAKAVNALQLVADEEQARIDDIEQRRVATEAVDAKAVNALSLIATEKTARIEDIEQRRIATEAVDLKALNALQLIADEEEARISDVEQRRIEIVAADGKAVAADAKAVNALDLIADEESARITAIEQRRVATVAAEAKAQNALDLIADETEARGVLQQTMNTNFGNLASEYVKQTTLFSTAGAAKASDLNLLSAKVGSTSVAAQITAFKNAQIGYVNGSGNWVEGAAFAQAFDEINITGALGSNLSIYSYFQAIENELGELEGEIQFAVDNNGEITGVFVKGSSTQSVLTFVGNSIRFVDTQGNFLLRFNTSSNQLEFFGGGEFKGKISAPEYEMSSTAGSTFTEYKSTTPFGPDNLVYWRGARLVWSSGAAKTSQMTIANSFECITSTNHHITAGQSTIKGLLSAGAITPESAVLSTSRRQLAPFTATGSAMSNGSRAPRTIYLPQVHGQGYGSSDFEFSLYRAAHDWVDINLEIMGSSDTGQDDKMQITVYARYEMVDTSHSAHAVDEEIYSAVLNSDQNQHYGSVLLFHTYTTRAEPWERLRFKITGAGINSGQGDPMSLTGKWTLYNNRESIKTPHTSTSDNNSNPGNGSVYPPRDDVYCVHPNTWLVKGLQAKDAKIGDEIDVCNKAELFKGNIVSIDKSHSEQSVKIRTANGAEILVSKYTPCTRPDGTMFWSREALGELIYTDVNGVESWEKVVSVDDIGLQPVVKINVNNMSFAAGSKPDARIVTHNIQFKY